jgi:hypothetical protein
MQQQGKNTSITKEELLRKGVSIGADPRLYNEEYKPARKIEGISEHGSQR